MPAEAPACALLARNRLLHPGHRGTVGGAASALERIAARVLHSRPSALRTSMQRFLQERRQARTPAALGLRIDVERG